MNDGVRKSLGVLIGGVHTYFPKEIIRGIAKESEKQDMNIYFFLGMQAKVFLKQVLGEHADATYDYQFNTIYDYCKIAGLDGVIINYGTIGLYLMNDDSETFAKRYNDMPVVLLTTTQRSEPITVSGKQKTGGCRSGSPRKGLIY